MTRLKLIFITICALKLCAARENSSILDCLFDDNSLQCIKNVTDSKVDAMELETIGRSAPDVTISKVIERSGSFLVDLFADNEINADESDRSGVREARGHKLSKKKKKLLQKLIPLLMLLKAKFSLFLQLIGTHFQFKFFAIAVISLIVNVARFWLELKHSHAPTKVIYYEHAQHQHHYDNDDDHGGYWKRSIDNSRRENAYSAWAPDR